MPGANEVPWAAVGNLGLPGAGVARVASDSHESGTRACRIVTPYALLHSSWLGGNVRDQARTGERLRMWPHVGNKALAIVKLLDFIAFVGTQSGRHIATDAAQILVADAKYVIGTLR